MGLDVNAAVAAIKDAFKTTPWKICIDRENSYWSDDGQVILWYLLAPEGEWPRAVHLVDDVGAELTDALPNASLQLGTFLTGGDKVWDELDALLAQLPVTVEPKESDEELTERVRSATTPWAVTQLSLTPRASIGSFRAVPHHDETVELASLFPSTVTERIEEAASE